MYIVIVSNPICFKLSLILAMVISREVISWSRFSIMRSQQKLDKSLKCELHSEYTQVWGEVQICTLNINRVYKHKMTNPSLYHIIITNSQTAICYITVSPILPISSSTCPYLTKPFKDSV